MNVTENVTSVYLEQNNQEFLLCSLQRGPGAVLQQPLDLGFLAGETVTLFTTGKGGFVRTAVVMVYLPNVV